MVRLDATTISDLSLQGTAFYRKLCHGGGTVVPPTAPCHDLMDVHVTVSSAPPPPHAVAHLGSGREGAVLFSFSCPPLPSPPSCCRALQVPPALQAGTDQAFDWVTGEKGNAYIYVVLLPRRAARRPSVVSGPVGPPRLPPPGRWRGQGTTFLLLGLLISGGGLALPCAWLPPPVASSCGTLRGRGAPLWCALLVSQVLLATLSVACLRRAAASRAGEYQRTKARAFAHHAPGPLHKVLALDISGRGLVPGRHIQDKPAKPCGDGFDCLVGSSLANLPTGPGQGLGSFEMYPHPKLQSGYFQFWLEPMSAYKCIANGWMSYRPVARQVGTIHHGVSAVHCNCDPGRA